MQARLDQLTTETGRPHGDFIQDALAGYFGELSQLRRTLDTRYDEIQCGQVQLPDSEEVRVRMREKSASRRSSTSG